MSLRSERKVEKDTQKKGKRREDKRTDGGRGKRDKDENTRKRMINWKWFFCVYILSHFCLKLLGNFER